MVKSTIEFKLEEYKDMREEIRFLEKSIGQFFLFAVIASISLLSAIGSFFIKLNLINDYSIIIITLLFLFPPLIPISVLFILGSHRRNIHRIGTYIQLFLEGNGLGEGWESRIDKFRKYYKDEESFDYIPIVFWIIYFLSISFIVIVIYLFYQKYQTIDLNNFQKILLIILPLIEGFFLRKAQKEFNFSSFEIRDEYIAKWEKIPSK